MKKNILLLSILAVLLTFAYWWEERGMKNDYLSENLLEMSGEVSEVDFLHLTILKKRDQWMTKAGYPLGKVEDFFRRFSEIKLIRALESYNYNHDKLWLTIKKNQHECSFYFSTPNEHTGNFFITRRCEKRTQHWLAESTVTFDGLYKDDNDRKLRSYHAMSIELLQPALQDLTETRLVDFWPPGKLVLSNEKKTQLIDLDLKLTQPAVIEGLSYDRFYFSEAEKKIKNLIPLNFFQIGELDPKRTFLGRVGTQALAWNIFESEKRCFIIKEQIAAELKGQDCLFFSSSIYLYWMTTGIDFTEALKTDQVTAKFAEKEFQLTLDDKTLNQHWKVLICYLSKCNENFVPYYVGKSSLKGSDLELTYKGDGAQIKIRENDIEIFSLKKKILLKFPNTYKLKLEDLKIND